MTELYDKKKEYLENMPQLDLVTIAVEIAALAHKEQKDKCGIPYISHPLRVMLMGKNEDEQILGVLHDVIEDSEWTLEQVAARGMPEHIIIALDAITHRSNEPNLEYLGRVVENSLAEAVKRNDIKDNGDPIRLDKLDEETQIRLRNKHMYSLDFLNGRREFPKGALSGRILHDER